jgi:hypothetical protein
METKAQHLAKDSESIKCFPRTNTLWLEGALLRQFRIAYTVWANYAGLNFKDTTARPSLGTNIRLGFSILGQGQELEGLYTIRRFLG